VALVLPSVIASGAERRIAFVYRHLERRYPGEYRLVVSRDLYQVLNAAGFGLDRLPGVRVLGHRPSLDRKAGAHAPWWINLGRLITLARYRRDLVRLAEREALARLHAYLELVPFLGLWSIDRVPWFVAIVDHTPRYFDPRSVTCRFVVRAARRAVGVDCVYDQIARRMEALGVPADRLHFPLWNTVNHEAFHPEPKDLVVSFAARAIDWKNPLLMVEVIDRVWQRNPGLRFAVLGGGQLRGPLRRAILQRPWRDRVRAGYLPDPSVVVNRSLIHVTLDQYDNITNQSLLEGMAAGCAIVASDVGETHRVVDEEVGVRVELRAEAIADAILSLVDQRPRAEAMGRAARDRILTRHHVDRYVEYFRALGDAPSLPASPRPSFGPGRHAAADRPAGARRRGGVL